MGKEIIRYVPGPGFLKAPVRGSDGAACWDILATEDAELTPFKAVKIATALSCALPKNHVLLLLPRSGFSFKNQILIPNSLGVIDSDFRGSMSLTMLWMPDPLGVLDIFYHPYGCGDDLIRQDAGLSLEYRLGYQKDAVFKIEKGHRITQALLVEYKEQDWEAVDALEPTRRGDGGFGSTGLRPEDPVADAAEKARSGRS